MIVDIKNQFGAIKHVKIGFSWTMLFFGFFVPLSRRDWKWVAISFLASIFTAGICWFIFPFVYNKMYIGDLIEKGWEPADAEAEEVFLSKGMITPDWDIY